MRFLEVKDVVSGYGKIPILHGLSLHVNQGRWWGLLVLMVPGKQP